ncbi:MAG: threonine/serine dehydratase [Chloroflexia bacterium]|nr:threonine/serine dehydratase [Chloroflexia bacterium]
MSQTRSDPISQRDIHLAQQRIAALTRRTPLCFSPSLSLQSGRRAYLKLENLQQTGSFKVRGAANCIQQLISEQQQRGVITVSTGNHGRAVAYVANQLGLPALICLSRQSPPYKVAAIRDLGAEVFVHGSSYDEAEAHSFLLQQERGLSRIEPFDDPRIIAGQGVIGLELLEELPQIDTAVIPLSGGGLLSGIALALKAVRPTTRIIGVSMERAPVMVYSLRVGRPSELPEQPTLADALVGGIGRDNHYTFRLVQRYLDEAVLVSEPEIAHAMAWALQEHQLVVEGGGAVGLAALLAGKVAGLGQHVAVVISGGNVKEKVLQAIVAKNRIVLESGGSLDEL